MKKPVFGVSLGAVTFFVWGMISWMVLPWHNATMKTLPEEQLISDTLKTVVDKPGLYFFPSDQTAAGPLNETEWSEKYKKGPIGLLVFSPTGKEPMGPTTFIVGFLGELAVAALVMFVLASCRERVAATSRRVLLSAALGAVVSLTCHVPYWNWFHFPADFTLVAIGDTLVAFTLLGLVMAKFVPE